MVSSNGGSSVICEKCPENMVSIELFILYHNNRCFFNFKFPPDCTLFFINLKLFCIIVFAWEFLRPCL